MSYSFSARGATKGELAANVAAELDKVVVSQPVHKADRRQAQAAVESFLGILPDAGEGKMFSASVNGSVGWTGDLDQGHVLTGAGVSVSVHIVPAA